jgi:hypothetical protein
MNSLSEIFNTVNTIGSSMNLFEEPGTLEKVTRLTSRWSRCYFSGT